MWPWGHLALAYVLYSSFSRVTQRRPPAWPGVALVALGSQAPDLIDKPLAWTLTVLPSGRSLGHSLITGTLVVLLVVWILRRFDLPGRAAFAIGYYSHLVGDAYRLPLTGNFHDYGYYLWPLISSNESETPSVGILQYLLDARFDSEVVVRFVVAVVVVVAWWLFDGAPGAAEAWNAVRRRVVRVGS